MPVPEFNYEVKRADDGMYYVEKNGEMVRGELPNDGAALFFIEEDKAAEARAHEGDPEDGPLDKSDEQLDKEAEEADKEKEEDEDSMPRTIHRAPTKTAAKRK